MFDFIESTFSLIGKGGIMMLPIGVCSIIALTIIIERLYYFRKTRENPVTNFEVLNNLLNSEGHEAASKFATTSKGPVGAFDERGTGESGHSQMETGRKINVDWKGRSLKNLAKISVVWKLSLPYLR